MKTYKIIGITNVWIASRDINFNGKTSVVFEKNLSLKEAQAALLCLFNDHYETSFSNWGMVRCHYPCSSWSRIDGTRSYEYDSRFYSIEEEFVEQ